MNDEFQIVLNIPYPKIEVSSKDVNLAYKLFNVYAGRISELSAITQYSFQSIYLKNYHDLSNILEKISKVEMRHLKILGDLIKELGLTPYYVTYSCDKQATPWNTDFIDSTTDYRSMLISNINSEVVAIKDYNDLISCTNDPNIKEIIKRIIIDEEHHLKIFTELLRQYDSYEI